MYLEAIDLENRGRYAVNLSGLGLFGSKKKKRRRAAAQAERDAAALRIANLEKMVLLKHKPDIPVMAAPVAPVVAPIGPAPVVNIAAPVPVTTGGLPGWAIPAGIGAALLLVAAIIIPQMKKAK